MDSGNSGSLQSSSGGDDHEFDSRATDSFFMSPPPMPLPLQQPPPPPLFDPFPDCFQPRSSNSALYDNSTSAFWPANSNLRSDQAFNNMMNDSFTAASFQEVTGGVVDRNQTTARNPKKRSRASRRAPTTVLTTDTTNFRAMVQEFTGIPAPPFTSSSSSQRNRLDLFRRTFSLKVQSPPPPPPFPVSSAASTSFTTPPIHYGQLPTLNSNHVFNNTSNPNFTSLLQTNVHKFPSNIKMSGGNLSEFSSCTASVDATLASLISSSDHIPISSNFINWRRNNINADEVQTSLVHDYDYTRNSRTGPAAAAPSTSDFHGKGGPENIATTTEAMVESRNCSSDKKSLL